MAAAKFDDENDALLTNNGKVVVPFYQDRYVKFALLVSGILFFFGCHNYMQELIMSLPGFKVCISIR